MTRAGPGLRETQIIRDTQGVPKGGFNKGLHEHFFCLNTVIIYLENFETKKVLVNSKIRVKRYFKLPRFTVQSILYV